MSRIGLLSLFALTACGGSVSLEEVDGFGGVASAVWLYNDDNDTHRIILTNVAGACGKLQAKYEADDAFADAFADLGPNDLNDYCEVMEEPSMDVARADDALYHEGAHHLTFWVLDGGDTEPDDDEYEVGGDPAVDGNLYYYESSPGRAAQEQYDPEAEDDIFCGVDEDDLELDADSWYLSDGELVIEDVVDEQSVRGTFEGELEQSNGKGAGDILFDFTATYCEIG